MKADEATTSGVQDPSSSTSSASGSGNHPVPAMAPSLGPEDALEPTPPRRGAGMLYGLALLLSAAWLGVCAWYIGRTMGWPALPDVAPEVFGGLAAGALVPVAVLWLVVSTIERGTALRHEARLLREHLARLTYPDAAARARVGQVTEALKAQADDLTAASRRAVERAEAARAMLSEENRALERVSGAVGGKATDAANSLKEQVAALEDILGRVESVGKRLSDGLAKHTGAVDGATTKAEEAGVRLFEVLDNQTKVLDTLTQNTTGRVEALEHLVERQEGVASRAEQAGKTLREAAEILAGSTTETLTSLADGADRVETAVSRLDDHAVRARDNVAAAAKSLDEAADGVLKRAEDAGRALDGAKAGMAAAADEAAARIDGVTGKAEGYAQSVNDMAGAVTERLETVGSTALERVRALGIATDNIGARAREASEDVRSQADLLEQTAVRVQRQTGGIRGSLEKQVEAVDAVVARLNERLTAGEAALSEQAKALDGATAEALARLESITGGVKAATEETDAVIIRATAAAENVEARTKAIATVAEDARDRLTALTEDLRKAGAEIEETAGGADMRLAGLNQTFIDRARKIVAALDTALDEVVSNAEQRGETVGARFGQRAEELDAAVAQAVAQVEERLWSAGKAMETQAAALNEVVDQAAQQAEGRIAALNTAVTRRAAGLLAPIDEAARGVEARLSTVGEGMEAKAADLAALIDRTAGSAEDRVAILVAALRERGEGLAQPVDEAAHRVEARMDALGMDLGKRTRFLTEQIERATGDCETRVGDLAQRLAGNVNALTDSADRAADALAATDAGVRERAEMLAQITDGALQHIGELAHTLDVTGNRLHDIVVNGSTAVGESAEALDNAVATYREHTGRIAEEMRLASEDFRVRFRDIGRTSEEAMEKVSAALEEMRSQTDGLSRASDRLTDQTERAGTLFERRAETLNHVADRAEEKLRALEASRDQADLQRFLNSAVFIIERLQSVAVDVTRLFSPTVDEELWQRYYRGDTSAFLRHAARTLTRKQAGQIRELYGENAEFREYVNRYITEYESLLRTARHTDRAEVLAATLTSADMGKLYLVLARAVGRPMEG